MTPSSRTIPVHSFGSSEASTQELPAFLVNSVSPYLVAQVAHTTRQRGRVRTAHTKDRAEVRGGGKKPWKQKGTGRARHGSIRSPIWRGGGIVFGPRSHHERIVPTLRRMRRKALAGVLADKASTGNLLIVRLPDQAVLKTKDVISGLFRSKGQSRRGVLVVLDSSNILWMRALRNIPGIRVVSVERFMLQEAMQANVIWVDEKSLPALERRCQN